MDALELCNSLRMEFEGVYGCCINSYRQCGEHLYSWRLDKQCCYVYDISGAAWYWQDTTS